MGGGLGTSQRIIRGVIVGGLVVVGAVGARNRWITILSSGRRRMCAFRDSQLVERLRLLNSERPGTRMAKRRELPMPDDWADAIAWDAYHRSRLAKARRDPGDDETGSIGAEQLPQLAAEMNAQGWRSVWVRVSLGSNGTFCKTHRQIAVGTIQHRFPGN